ncbi:MAG: class I SAM-dependent methyltransferase [Rubripirellula sp.]
MNIENSRFPMTKLVVLFNWHFFLIAALVCVAGVIAFAMVPIPWIRVVLGIGVMSAIYFIVASVIASYFVYDHSDLYRLDRWPDRVIPEGATAAALVHAGFDPASQKLIRKYPHLHWSVLDFFDSETTTERSIRTARKLFPPANDEIQIKATQWPVHDGSQDVIFAISAAHEIRNDQERAIFFQEAKRCLKPTGRMVVIEQLRDSRNFLVFGAAVLHFLSHRTWLKSFRAGGLKTIDEFWMSPWMKTFVLTPEE